MVGGLYGANIEAETELSLTVPITNSLAFLFTVLGEWWAEGKVIGRGPFTTFLTSPLYFFLFPCSVSICSVPFLSA